MINEGHTYRALVPATAAGELLVAFLAATWTHSTREEWQQRVREGRVRVDGQTVAADAALHGGQAIEWRRPPWQEPDAPRRFEVRYADDHLIVVAKPAGLPTLPGAGYLENTLLAAVRAHWPAAAPVHRLGRWTSGLVVFGRTPAIRAQLSARWNSPACHKRYRLLAQGCPPQDEFRIDAAIGPVPFAPLGTIHAATADGRAAVTRVRVLERRGDHALCDAYLESGRPHQIRIHLAFAGHPLVGDPLYAADGVPHPFGGEAPALPGDPGYRLHAAEVTLTHPVGGRVLSVASPPPPELRACAERRG